MSAIEDTTKLLDSEGGVTRVCQEVESWAKAGRWQDLLTLAEVLERESDPSDKEAVARFEAAADHLEDQVALVPGKEAIDALLALSLRDRQRSVTMPRARSMRLSAFASRLGYGQSKDEFLSALERAGEKPEHQELFACWLQEVVLRGNTSLEEDSRARRFRDTLKAGNHPLAALPLVLLSTEREAPSYMPLYGDKGLGRAIDTLASGSMSIRTIPPPADGAAVRATKVDDKGATERMVAAVRPWTQGKSGKVEAKIFTLAPSVEGGAVGSWLLRALPLDSTNAVARLDCSRTGPEGVFGPLFSAASNGGAYSSGLGGAYGRLSAWNSLGALVAAPADAAVEAIEALAKKCTFLTFRAPGPWFHDVAWDLGALVLRPDGATVAVLAATDNE